MKKGIEFKIQDGKLLSAKKEPLERVNVGNCYYCGEPVLVGQGQAIKWKVLTTPSDKQEYPTHKKCRKLGELKK